MTIRKILTEPDLFLRQNSIKVDKVDDEIRSLMTDMLETMYDAPGIGLAAIQIGVPKRVIVIDLSRDDEKKNPLYFINPEIITNSDNNAAYEEGCLSVPGFTEIVNRPKHILVNALNKEGSAFEFQPNGLLAVCIQHEIDHLNGKLFVDYLSPLKHKRLKKKLEKQRRHDDSSL